MNIEELEKEAEEFELANTTYDVVESNGKTRTKKVCDITIQEAYVAGAEPREKRIEELQNNINKLQGYLDHDIEYDMDKQLAQTKDLLKRLHNAYTTLIRETGVSVYPAEVYYEVYKFLKEIENE